MVYLAQAFSGTVMNSTTHGNVARIGAGRYRLRIFGGPVGTTNPTMIHDSVFSFTSGGPTLTVSYLSVGGNGVCSITVPAGSQALGAMMVTVSLED